MSRSFLTVLVALVITMGAFLVASVYGFSAHTARMTSVAPVLALVEASESALMDMMAQGGKTTPRYTEAEAQLATAARAAEPALIGALSAESLDVARPAAYALGYANDADAAASALVAALRRNDEGLTNNVGLSLMALAEKHPSLDVPLPPLIRKLHSHTWTDQQKIGQVIQVLAMHRPIADPNGELAQALIPMLLSQRSRVRDPARDILPRVTGQSLGNKAERWVAWFAQRHGRSIDLTSAIYELLQIVRPSMVENVAVFTVAGQEYRDLDALVARLAADAMTTRNLGRQFAIAVQIPEQGYPPDRMETLGEALFTRLAPIELVISPMGDDFHPFDAALARLQRLSADTVGAAK